MKLVHNRKETTHHTRPGRASADQDQRHLVCTALPCSSQVAGQLDQATSARSDGGHTPLRSQDQEHLGKLGGLVEQSRPYR